MCVYSFEVQFMEPENLCVKEVIELGYQHYNTHQPIKHRYMYKYIETEILSQCYCRQENCKQHRFSG